MVANNRLVELMHISEEDVQKINALHVKIDNFIKEALKDVFTERFVYDTLREWEFELQELWQFAPDEKYHNRFKEYKFKKHWVGRTFKCVETGATLTIPADVYETEFFKFGNCFIDVGRWEFYSRQGGMMVEVTEEKTI